MGPYEDSYLWREEPVCQVTLAWVGLAAEVGPVSAAALEAGLRSAHKYSKTVLDS